jgi:hypothetical protein
MGIHNLESGDYTFKIFGENATFLSIIDIDTHDIYDYDWDYESLCERLVKRMNLKKTIVWGCSYNYFQIRMTMYPNENIEKTHFRSFSLYFETHGVLCLGNLDSVAMCAQFNDYKLPQPQDGVFTLPPSGYLVTVYQMFPREDEYYAESINEGDNYIINFKNIGFHNPDNSFNQIPWRI